MTKPGCETCRAITREHNVAIANGLFINARLVRLRLEAHEKTHERAKTCCPDIPTTRLGADTLDAWMRHDLMWHGNFFARREPDGSLTRVDPTTVTVTVSPREGGTQSNHEDS